jgi:hypothetical protein
VLVPQEKKKQKTKNKKKNSDDFLLLFLIVINVLIYNWIKTRKDNTLYSELLSTQLSLKSIMIKDPPEVHKTVGLAIIRIGGALEMASSLESRLKTVIEVSKKTILDKAQKIKDLEYQLQDGKPSLDAALQDNKLLKIKLKEVEDTIRHVECLLLESQIEPTKEEGGTLLQRIESLLAISTASSLLNDKLRSELETSDTMVEELFDETSKLLKLVESDDQKMKQEKELCRLQTKVYDLEKNINYLNHQLESNQDTIRQLKDENQQKSKQLSDSYIAFRKKEDIEFCNNIIRPETIQHENRHFSELPDEDSLTAWQEIAQNRSQLGGFNYKSNKSSLIDFDQSDTEQQTSQFPYTDMKQSFSGFLELPEELDRKHPQVNSHQPVTKGNMLDKTNEFFHHGGLVDQSNDTNQYNLESKSQPLNRSISIDQYTSMNSKVTSYNTHLLKAFYSIQDMESLTHSGVYHEGIKSENDLSLHIHKNTDFRYAGSTHDGTQISGTMYSKKDLNHQHSGSDMLGNRIFKGDIQSTGLENVTLYPGRKTKKQEELIRIHTRAQLGLIEYLEGENNVTLALSRFRKQLENEMDELEYLN